MTTRIQSSFYNRDTCEVSRDLLGCRLVRMENGKRISGIITETEAYCGEEDLGCHAKAGRTARTEVMYGPPGYAFVYLTYGMHWMFCPVTQPIGQPEAVLIRAIEPTEGIEIIQQRRGKQPRKLWTDGPGKLSKALNINGKFNKLNLTSPNAEIWIEKAVSISDEFVTTGPRIGLYTVPEPWKSIPWRYLAHLPAGWLKKQGIKFED